MKCPSFFEKQRKCFTPFQSIKGGIIKLHILDLLASKQVISMDHTHTFSLSMCVCVCVCVFPPSPRQGSVCVSFYLRSPSIVLIQAFNKLATPDGTLVLFTHNDRRNGMTSCQVN